MIKPGVRHLEIPKGATFSEPLLYSTVPPSLWTPPMTPEEVVAVGMPVDLTGYSAAAKGRARIADASPVWSLSSAPGGGITLGGALGTITLAMSAAVTAALAPGSGVWDLELTSPGGEVIRLMKGTYEITEEATR